MNIIEYSIRLGKALNKTELGKEIKIYMFLLEMSTTSMEKKWLVTIKFIISV